MSNHFEQTVPLIRDYRLELAEIPCIPGSPAWNARALLDNSMGAALPYLNAELKGADYHHDLKTLIWKNGGRKYAFRPTEIGVAPVEDREDARRLLDDIVGVVNAIWKRRADIKPCFSRRRVPSLMDIYKLLPGTNCKECGYSSCMAFAAQLREGNAELSQCPHLSGDFRAAISDQLADRAASSGGSGNE